MSSAAENKTPILDLFETTYGRKNRQTEMLFVERCLDLLRPGGRLGIVLPDGVLNNPSKQYSDFRAYVETRAKLLAVVSIPQDTFGSADATVKPSLVFLKRWTDEELDQINQLRASLAARLAKQHQDKRSAVLDEVASLQKTRPGRGATSGERKAWREKVRACNLKLADLDALVDKLTEAALRKKMDYPIFFAEPEEVGITSTGADGPNELPNVLAAYKRVEKWIEEGCDGRKRPRFS